MCMLRPDRLARFVIHALGVPLIASDCHPHQTRSARQVRHSRARWRRLARARLPQERMVTRARHGVRALVYLQWRPSHLQMLRLGH
jgi:hypothetical protein